MKKYMVSVEIVTAEMDLSAISRILGIHGSTSSHNKGDRRGLNEVWDMTTWKLESELEDARPLHDHVDHLLPRALPAIARERARLPKDGHVYLNIGVIFQTVSCGIALSADHLKRISEADMDLDVTTYP